MLDTVPVTELSSLGNSQGPAATTGDEVRANTYALIGALLTAPPSAQLIGRLTNISEHDTSPSEFGPAWAALREAGANADVASLDDEHHNLFIGVGRGELMPFGSWYMTGFMMDAPLAALREDLADLGYERRSGVTEPEDHAGALLETMAMLIANGEVLVTQRRFFERHLGPWMKTFFVDLQKAKAAGFYRAVGQFGERFIGFEEKYLTMLA